jgi:hypothetical protein
MRPPGFEVLRRAALAQDFACGLGRPQNGSSSIPSLATTLLKSPGSKAALAR